MKNIQIVKNKKFSFYFIKNATVKNPANYCALCAVCNTYYVLSLIQRKL